MTFFHTSIPTPADVSQFQRLGHVQLGSVIIDVYWRRGERQVLFQLGDYWFLQPDNNIRKSLAVLMDLLERDVALVRLSILERGRFRLADPEIVRGFLDCDWSDFALDYMVINATILPRQRIAIPDEVLLAPLPLDDMFRTPPRIRRELFRI
jgi:hypothetical protein